MSRRREVEERLRALGEIQDVLGAMKNLALMETQKLARFLATQRRVVESIDAALADLLAFHPELGRRNAAAPGRSSAARFRARLLRRLQRAHRRSGRGRGPARRRGILRRRGIQAVESAR